MEDRSISLEWANILAIVLGPLIVLIVFGPVLVVGKLEILAQGWSTLLRTLLQPLVLIPGLLLTIVVHEGLYALGFLLGGAPREGIRFGIHRRSLSPYAGCRIPLQAGAYRFVAALPALILGGVPWLLGIILDAGVLIVIAFWMLWFAGGDLIILWLIRDLPSTTLVIDHPERAGCKIVQPQRSA